MALMTAQGVYKSFGGVMALRDVDMCVEQGQILGVIGPNGSGKTTFFNVLTGLYRADKGQIIFDGVNITHLPPHEITRQGICRTFQNIRLFGNQSILENVLVGEHVSFRAGWPDVLGRTAFQRKEEQQAIGQARERLDSVGLHVELSDLATGLPYGAQRRVEIARALGSNPKLLLLDEPTAGMSIAEANDVMALVRKIRESGVTIMLVEHNMRVLMGLADRVVVLDSGAKIAEGTPQEVQCNKAVLAAYLGEA